jgi:nitrogen fixation/metabolism regulation signal transduction histidine kinase
LIGAALAGVLLFLLATASANTALFARHYSLLLGLNAALAALLAALVAWQLVLLVRRYRQREFGSRLRLRLLVMLGLMALLPGAMVYFVSVQFLARSIESWFDVKVDAALEGAKFLGQSSSTRCSTTCSRRAARSGTSWPTARSHSKSCCSTGCANRRGCRTRCC